MKPQDHNDMRRWEEHFVIIVDSPTCLDVMVERLYLWVGSATLLIRYAFLQELTLWKINYFLSSVGLCCGSGFIGLEIEHDLLWEANKSHSHLPRIYMHSQI